MILHPTKLICSMEVFIYNDYLIRLNQWLEKSLLSTLKLVNALFYSRRLKKNMRHSEFISVAEMLSLRTVLDFQEGRLKKKLGPSGF